MQCISLLLTVTVFVLNQFLVHPQLDGLGFLLLLLLFKFFTFLPILGIKPDISHLLVTCSAGELPPHFRNTFQSQVTHVYSPSTWEVEEAIVSYIVSLKSACLGCRVKYYLSTHYPLPTPPQHTETTSTLGKQSFAGLLKRASFSLYT